MEAKLYKRTGAFLVDGFILYIISVMLLLVFNTSNTDKLYDRLDAIGENYLNSEISYDEYINEYAEVNYLIDREQIFVNVVNVIVVITLFVFVPLYNGGSTIGKKLFKIKIVDKEGNIPSVNRLLFRSMLINSLGYLLVTLAAIFVLKSNTYLMLTIILSLLEVLLVFISTFMVLYRRDKCGIHDLIVGTKVVNM